MTGYRSLCFRYYFLGLVSGPFLLLLIGLLTAHLWLPATGRWLTQPAQIANADAIVVLSGGGLARMMQGIELYRQGLAPQIWYTGDAPLPDTDGQLAREFALKQGVPPEAIRLLSTTSTWEDGQEIATAVRHNGTRRILVVTTWYHSRRALCVLRRHLIDMDVAVYYSAPPMLRYGPTNWWQQEDGLVSVFNELLKFGFYWWQYGLTPWEC